MSGQKISSVVSPAWLAERLGAPGLVVVDCRFVLGQPDTGRAAYAEAHIPGALYADLERDLSAPVGEHGGRHPLPAVEALAAVFGRLGIGNDAVVVAYDDQGGSMATRLWWLLRYVGHDAAAVLDGGFAAWRSGGYAVTAEPPAAGEPAAFAAAPRAELLADVARVRAVSAAIAAGRGGDGAAVLIDSRDGQRYRGEVEPIDRAAGHIPGAINRPWTEGRGPDGKWKSAAEQRARFADLPQDAEIIVYCGSGVTATPNFMALHDAGFTNVKLYAGSWSDWISYSENPVVAGDEELRGN